MNQNHKLLVAALFVGSTTNICCSNLSDVKNLPSLSKRNVLFIAVDDLKPLIASYGDVVAKTPNLDRLVAKGVKFSSAYCQQAVSAATRASLLTGLVPDNTEVWDLKTLIRDRNPDVVTLPQYFKSHGYYVVGMGKIFDGRSVRNNDELSWHDFYNFKDYYNTETGPQYFFYQNPETVAQMRAYSDEAKSKGLKGNNVSSYIRKRLFPAVECYNVPDDAYQDGALANLAVEKLLEIKSKSGAKPFFFAVGFHSPHLPFVAPSKYWDLYDRSSLPLPEYRKRAVGGLDYAYHRSGEMAQYTDTKAAASYSVSENTTYPEEKMRELIHGYYACVSYVDAQLGRLLDALDQSGEADNTTIVLWGDHGWHLGDHGLWAKHTPKENATHVPMLIVDSRIGCRVVDDLCEFVDIYPTLCSLNGLPIPSGLDGDDLVALMRGDDQSDNHTYAVSQYPMNDMMGYSIRDSRYRYTIWFDWLNRDLNLRKPKGWELYDYQNDPYESVNLANDPNYESVCKRMDSYFEEYKLKLKNK